MKQRLPENNRVRYFKNNVKRYVLLEDMEESRITGIINSKWVLEQENTGDDFASMFNQIDQQLGFTPADSYSLMSSGLYDNNNGLDTFGIFQQ